MDALLLKDVDIAALLQISRAGFWNMVKAGSFGPKKAQLPGRTARWRKDHVEKWISWDCPSRSIFVSMLEKEDPK